MAYGFRAHKCRACGLSSASKNGASISIDGQSTAKAVDATAVHTHITWYFEPNNPEGNLGPKRPNTRTKFNKIPPFPPPSTPDSNY